ncbi:lysophospholipid acyltransferase family protein [Corynebacterium lizhenjunii]|nr:lysophospholipid acyltransferase family protein [Corynebacterium lizhenjunii]
MELRNGLVRVPASLPQLPRHAEAGERVYQLAISLLERVLRFQGIRVTARGVENVPQFGPALLAMNHTGYYDFIFGEIPAYLRGRRLARFMAKKEVFEVPVLGRAMRAMRHVPVDRAAGAAAIDEAVDHLRSGRLVTIFPEATISRSFELKDFKNGAARIAYTADAPLIPMVTWGSQRIWAKGGKKNLGRTGTPVLIYVGQPLELSGDAAADTAALKAAMEELLAQARAEYEAEYGPFPPGQPWQPAALGGTAPTLEEANRMDEADRARKAREREEKAARKRAKTERKLDAKLAKKVRKAWRRLRKER